VAADAVVARAAVDAIVPAGAVERVVAGAADDRVVPLMSLRVVAEDLVVPAEPDDHVRVRRSLQRLAPRRADDRRRRAEAHRGRARARLARQDESEGAQEEEASRGPHDLSSTVTLFSDQVKKTATIG